MGVLGRLEHWYASRCDGDWEHQCGIKIDTIDNPGWSVEVDLRSTPLAARKFADVTAERSDKDWIHCRVRDAKFQGFGGSRNLREVIEVFLDWADACDSESK